ncbi:class I SAM-dependent rRNA methyltransferase [Thermodesulfitimonas autotrophica]|uniref:class I SAM-dependent rRNA methyltransferase n=1 Tax=Thermodesulfitimonas autotrophica TaxID=1894989 RepID=UPI002FE13498
MAEVVLLPGKEKRVQAGHPWVYRTEVGAVRGEFAPGDVVDIRDARGRYLGRGYANPASQIFIRFLTRQDEAVDRVFWRRRLELAAAYREKVVKGTTAYRLVNAEADFLPALIVDRYGAYLVVQFLSLGMERFKTLITELLVELFSPQGIYERSDVAVREREGLALVTGPLYGEVPQFVEIDEGGTRFRVDLHAGQKTGFFLDQRENRRAVAELAAGARVLDCFCYTGGFAVSAARGGAAAVLGIDISGAALALARENAALNGVANRCTFHEANSFDALRHLAAAGERFDLVVLDPPAFTKSKEALPGAIRGYKEINLRAMKLLPSGGFLVTCSCSYHLTEDLFLQVVAAAAHDARRTLRLVELRRQARDHPVLMNVPETYYLKCGIFQVF